MNTASADFPRGGMDASAPGVQPKVLARMIDGKYVVGLTAEELYARWYFCEDLAIQLAARTARIVDVTGEVWAAMKAASP